MPGHDVIVIGFSAGGVNAMASLVAGLPGNLPAAVFVAHHFPATSVSALPDILRRSGPLPASHAVHNERIEPGRIYIAPPGRHMLIGRDRVQLSRGPRENGHRPAIDPLFRTAARFYGPRVVGVLLSGSLDDGSVGLMAVKQHGGTAVVQDPDEALHDGMPRSGMARVEVDYILPIAEIGRLLIRLAREAAAPQDGPRPTLPEDHEPLDPAQAGTDAIEEGPLPGPPSALTCPECGGAIWESVDRDLARYRCHVGHAYTADSIVVAQASVVEAALWTAMRALEEKAELYRRLAGRSRNRGLDRLAHRFEAAVEKAELGSNAIRQLLLSGTAEAATVHDAVEAEEQTNWSTNAASAESA